MQSTEHDILAIVGRPNVGKSALFNRIVGRRVAIVHEESGVTRDRVSATTTWREKSFEVIDTGGIAFMDKEKSADTLATAARRQAEVAIEMATTILLVVDVTAGVTPLDNDIARKLRSSGKRVLLAINKVDHERRESGAAEFSELGFDETFSISAVHGQGISALLDAATQNFRTSTIAPPTAKPTRIAIVGRPNVGKSSLINCILQNDRAVVSDIPGTTRDSLDLPFSLRKGNTARDYILIDTAGLRHRKKINSSVEQFSLMRAERSIRNCEVAVLVLDAVAGVTKQDKKIAGQIFEAQCGCVIVVNKWDLAAEEEEERAREQRKMRRAKNQTRAAKSFSAHYELALRQELFFLDWAPLLFMSARTGENVGKLFSCIADIEREMTRRIDTPSLNKLLIRSLDSYPPPFVRGKRFKILYAFQRPAVPPTLTMFVNDPHCLTPHYQRFLIDKIRDAWGFKGCPVVLELKHRERKKFVEK